MPFIVTPVGFKRCWRCGITKPNEKFRTHKHTDTRNGKSYSRMNVRCSKCIDDDSKEIILRTNRSKIRVKINKSNHAARKYGHKPCITPINELEKTYTETCEYCKRFVGTKINLDHCHKTGIFRAWLCSRCNTKMGVLDSPDIQELIEFYNLRTPQQDSNNGNGPNRDILPWTHDSGSGRDKALVEVQRCE